jgi:rubrerythrin
MADFDNIYDILEFAIAREIDANLAYIEMASKAGNRQMRKVFFELAAEELEHKAKLELEMAKIGKVAPSMKDFSDLTVSDYMLEFESGADMDYQEVLTFAIKKERVAFKLYVDLYAVVKQPELRETLFALAEEEARHKMRFENEHEKLMQKRS